MVGFAMGVRVWRQEWLLNVDTGLVPMVLRVDLTGDIVSDQPEGDL
jgi:hypothetical protein